VVAVLYFARTILIPLALAVLLAFMLAPLVIRLRHWGFGRVPSVVVVVLFAFGMIGIVAALLTAQLSDLGHKLPEYEKNIRHKIETLRTSGGGLISRASQVARSLSDQFNPPATESPAIPGEEKPVPVEIRHTPFSPLETTQKIVGSLFSTVLMAGVVIVFVIFILVEREDLRDRILGLVGARRLNVTTKLLNDAAQRVSRYLLAQLMINGIFGLLVGIGLFFVRIPNPFLWGILAALLRYIPYLGVWIAAVMPAALAFAVEPGYVKVPLTLGLYLGVDLLMYNFLEPLLYGSSTGISPLAILVAAVFWAWLWGTPGLLLATPLTVCVATIGRYVPELTFLRVLLTDEPVLPPSSRFYQRMLAMDLEEATEIGEQYIKGKTLEAFYDDVIVPALSLAEEDRHRGKLDRERQQFIFENTQIIIEEFAERADELIAEHAPSKEGQANASRISPDAKEVQVLCVPARDRADELAAAMLVQLLLQRGIAAKALGGEALAGESLVEIEKDKPKVVCVPAVPPQGYTHARYICRRLRARFGELKLIAAILTEQDPVDLKQRQPAIPADEVAASLKEATTQILALLPTVAPAAEPILRAA